MPLNWTVQELIQIVSYGGGLDISSKKLTVQDAIQLASYSQAKGAKITLRDSGKWTVQEAIQIASYGKGNVIFAD
jgi:hypothetical protein